MKKIVFIFALLLSFGAFAKEINPTQSPDGTLVAYTDENNNLFVRDAEGTARQLTFDGSDLILNGYSSWVYYEEILGRPTRYRAFWWSPDSRRIAFYRFDNSGVPMFPIYSAGGKYGSISETRYPKAGDCNPQCRIGIVDLDNPSETVWAGFDYSQDQYFGTPFWGADSRSLFVQRMPRVQQHIGLFAVSAADGSLTDIYSEDYPTWVNWMDDMLFASDGLYMVRDFETGWQQIYYLSYDGKTMRKLTDGHNWRVSLRALDEKRGNVYFSAYRDSDVRACLYRLDKKGRITLLTPSGYNVGEVRFSDDFKSFTAVLSNSNVPAAEYLFRTGDNRLPRTVKSAPEGSPSYEIVYLTLSGGAIVPAKIALPKDFDPSRRYPVVMEIYGGPDTPYVTDDSRRSYSARALWYYNHGVIKVIADSRAAGHNGRADTDLVYRDLVSVPVADFCEWGRWLQSLPYVDPDRIGVEGFSFGGTMTAMLVMTHPEIFRCGIAGGGVYDWTLYDTHYTERFMDTPQRNPDGYLRARALEYVDNYDDSRTFLKITHGTGDDNVHFQNTLQLVDALQRAGKQFDLMIYPDGMHGYRGAQGKHDMEADAIFWTRHLNLDN